MERNLPLRRTRTQRPNRRMHGWTLPTTLFGLAILLSSVHLLTFESIDARQMIAEMLRGERLHQEEISVITTHLSEAGRCTNVSISKDPSHPVYEVCGEERRPLVSNPPSNIDPNLLIDYDTLFSTASTCPTVHVRTELPHKGAPRARNDCLFPSTLRSGLTVLENIRGESLTLSPPSSGFVLLATPGGVSVSGDLTIAGDLLIVAGGDVEIGGIRGVTLRGVKVTVISSLGGVKIGRTYGAVSLLVAGRGSLVAPETTKSSSFPMPPGRSASVYSFRAVDDSGG